MSLQAEGMWETEITDLLLFHGRARLSGSGFILKIPTINYKKFKKLKTSQERDTRNSGDYSMVLTINEHMELWKLIWTLQRMGLLWVNYMSKVTLFSTIPSMRITELPLPTPNIVNISSFLSPSLIFHACHCL